MSRERREFVRVLHSNAEGQLRSKIKPSKKEGKKGRLHLETRDYYRLDSRNIDPTGDRPYRYQPRGCGWFHNRGDKRIPSKYMRNSVCGKLSHRFPLYLLGKHRPTGRPVDRPSRSVPPRERYAGKGLSELFPVVHRGGLSLRRPPPLLCHLHRERRSD